MRVDNYEVTVGPVSKGKAVWFGFMCTGLGCSVIGLLSSPLWSGDQAWCAFWIVVYSLLFVPQAYRAMNVNRDVRVTVTNGEPPACKN